MNKTATVRARIEPGLKRSGDRVLKKIGLTPSDAVTLFYKQITLRNSIPFSLNVPNPETEKAIREARAGVGMKKMTFEEFAQEMRSL
jgi:DNA-damage-inducible protein J